MSSNSQPTSGVSVSSIPASCPYARAMLEQQPQQDDSNDAASEVPAVVALSLPPAVAEEWKRCPAFSAYKTNDNGNYINEESTGTGDATTNKTSPSCPFKGAKSPEEISKTLSQIPPSHFGNTATSTKEEKHAFMKTLAYLHSSGHGGGAGGDPLSSSPSARGGSVSSPSSNNSNNVISKVMAMAATPEGSNGNSSMNTLVTQCPVKPYLPKGWSFDQTLEEFSLASIMSKLAEQHERKEDEQQYSQPTASSPDYADTSSASSTNSLGSMAGTAETEITGQATIGESDDEAPSKNPPAIKLSSKDKPRTTVLWPSKPSSSPSGQRRLSDALKAGTARAHEAAESVHFVKNFIRGKIDRQLYALLVAQLFHVYRRLEEALDEHAPAHFAAVHFPSELNRTQALQEDVDFWHSDLKEGVEPPVSPASQDYIGRIKYLEATNPLLLLAHAYTRYLGDLSGGKILARVARRALRLDKSENGRAGEGLRFYDFDKIQSFKKFKDLYRQSLNDLALDQEQVQAIVQEANVAFLLNMRLFEELDVLGGVPGASVRSLEAVYEESKLSTKENGALPVTAHNEIPPECPFAKTASNANTATQQQSAANDNSVQKKGVCPWPFILLHEPKEGMKRWQTWAVIGLILSYLHHCYLSSIVGVDDDSNDFDPIPSLNDEAATTGSSRIGVGFVLANDFDPIPSLNEEAATTGSSRIGVGFGTAGLGGNTPTVTGKALEEGFRKFDTAEADWWYDQPAVGRSLRKFWQEINEPVDQQQQQQQEFFCDSLQVSTKIPPWSLTSSEDIRRHAMESRQELVGFCDCDSHGNSDFSGSSKSIRKPLDVYYIHAPRCWQGWHPRCNDPPPNLLDLRHAWMAMEAVVDQGSAQRIGLSNIHPPELLDLIEWTHGRLLEYEEQDASEVPAIPRPRIPDAVQIYADPINPASEMRQICQEYDIEFVSYSTLGTQHRDTGNVNPILTSPVVQALATKHQRSVAEVVLSWALQLNMSVIPRSSKPEHIEELARMLVDSDSGASASSQQQFLHPEDMDAMDTLDKDYVSEL
eukprot:CAMPEP_0113461420 /NCGR_PEP_ID=MMETSP0014_2-20120614/11534_1 /TAXON_ID=2857 /ORGANISM="Nitzschia sp." /LENGTH=1045 /DNA_ID=CAMNT_0000353185 /DNA_START=157 /DNA_END=3294 /DNA_ORIENTATION=- /assembly_acc=CAM_ASM_000159